MLGPDLKIYALKKIKLKKLDAQSIAQYTNEIKLLQSLQGNPHIIQLVAAEQDLQQRQINVVRFEVVSCDARNCSSRYRATDHGARGN
jgi:serine/threonine protein kinase